MDGRETGLEAEEYESAAAARRLEPNRRTQEEWLGAFAAFAHDHLAGLSAAPAVGALGSEAARITREVSIGIPERPLEGGVERVLELLARASEASYNTPGPGYLAYIPGGGLYAAALADFVANVLNRYTGVAAAAPALLQLEYDVLRWLGRELGYGPAATGLFTSGGSLAIWTAVVTARHARLGDSGDFRNAVAYTSSQSHHSVGKALGLAGISGSNLREIAVDGRFRMDVASLRSRIREDLTRGATPFLVVAAAGTTNTGAVDPLGAIADVCREEGLWLHVDGAYGGAFVLCPEGRKRLAGIERADSIAFDPHKGLFLPYGTGCLLVADGRHLREAHAADAHYLQDVATGADLPESPADLGPELSRDFRGLRLWLPLMLHGASAFRAALAEKLFLAEAFHDGLLRLRAAGLGIEIVDSPQLSVVPFRLKRDLSEPLSTWNRRNASFLAGINERRRVFLSSTQLPVEDGLAFTLRVCLLSFRTHEDRVARALEDVAAAARPALGARSSGAGFGGRDGASDKWR
jgi:aromatic-L-amino-acid/L-tryptophan decarboxylase